MTYIKTITTICFLIFAVVKISNACTCDTGKTPFCPTANEFNYIIQAVVTDKPYFYSIEVEVLENINQHISENKIIILGQDGLNCGETMDLFEVGDSLVLALFNQDSRDAINNEPYEWLLAGCGVSYLEYSSGFVYGAIDYSDDSRSYEDFKEGLIDCLTLSVSNKNILDEEISVYPSPANEILTIDTGARDVKAIELYSIQGKLMHRSLSLDKNTNSLDVSSLQMGIYLIRIETRQGNFIKRIVKN